MGALGLGSTLQRDEQGGNVLLQNAAPYPPKPPRGPGCIDYRTVTTRLLLLCLKP